MENASTKLNRTRSDRIAALRQLFLTTAWLHHRHIIQLVQQYGLTHPQCVTLLSLAAHQNSASMRELGEVSFQDGPTMTGIVDRLVKMKLVKRSRDEHDRRVVLVEITPAGIKLSEQIRQVLEEEKSLPFDLIDDELLSKFEALFDQMLACALNKMHILNDVDIETFKDRLRDFTTDPIEFVKMLEAMKDERK